VYGRTRARARNRFGGSIKEQEICQGRCRLDFPVRKTAGTTGENASGRSEGPAAIGKNSGHIPYSQSLTLIRSSSGVEIVGIRNF
jgi:hypothetical protein